MDDKYYKKYIKYKSKYFELKGGANITMPTVESIPSMESVVISTVFSYKETFQSYNKHIYTNNDWFKELTINDKSIIYDGINFINDKLINKTDEEFKSLEFTITEKMDYKNNKRTVHIKTNNGKEFTSGEIPIIHSTTDIPPHESSINKELMLTYLTIMKIVINAANDDEIKINNNEEDIISKNNLTIKGKIAPITYNSSSGYFCSTPIIESDKYGVRLFSLGNRLIICFADSIEFTSNTFVRKEKIIDFCKWIKSIIVLSKSFASILLCGHGVGMSSATIVSFILVYLKTYIEQELKVQEISNITPTPKYLNREIEDARKYSGLPKLNEIISKQQQPLAIICKILLGNIQEDYLIDNDLTRELITDLNIPTDKLSIDIYLVGTAGFPVIFTEEYQFISFRDKLKKYLHIGLCDENDYIDDFMISKFLHRPVPYTNYKYNIYNKDKLCYQYKKTNHLPRFKNDEDKKTHIKAWTSNELSSSKITGPNRSQDEIIKENQVEYNKFKTNLDENKETEINEWRRNNNLKFINLSRIPKLGIKDITNEFVYSEIINEWIHEKLYEFNDMKLSDFEVIIKDKIDEYTQKITKYSDGVSELHKFETYRDVLLPFFV